MNKKRAAFTKVSKMKTQLVPFLVLSVIGSVVCFLPHDVSVFMAESPESKHHADITLEALHKMVDKFLRENADLYPPESHDRLKNSSNFKATMRSFKSFVGKPDIFGPYDSDPSYHFTAEKFAEASMRILLEREKVINAIKLRTFDVARSASSFMFHVLQDFYSSTNWLEVGNQMIKEDVGTSSAFENVVLASDNEKTCDNCQPLGECYGNIKRDIVTEGKLTSAYFSKHKEIKPAGKCGYGGREDGFREMDAKGGINKDTKNPQQSPHFYLHNQAANMAVESTVDMLQRIYQATMDDRENFGEFLGIELLSSLCFVIDTTGSMSGEIEDVKELTINMTKEAEGSGKNFVLVPVNDPHPGIIKTTNDAKEMIGYLSELRADGGGDEPEMSMSGMLLAAQNVRFGSKCYVFTDAEAKDKELTETLKSVITLRRVKMDFKLTRSTKRKKRSLRRKRSLENDYREIAEVSGGSITLVNKGQLKEVLKTVVIESKISSVYISYGYLSDLTTFKFDVDPTMNEAFIEVSVIGTEIQNVNITSPDGNVHNAEILTNVPNNKVMRLSKPEIGQWKVSVGLTGSDLKYSFRVFCETSIDFTYTLISEKGASTDFSPIRGKSYFVSIDTYGPVNKDSLKVLFISVTGAILKEVQINRSAENLNAKTDLPTDDAGFFVALQGLDKEGNKFQRINPNIVKTTLVTLDLNLASNDSLDVKPGSTIKVKVKLSNRGVSFDGWNVKIFDSLKFLVSAESLDLTVAANLSETFELSFTAPANVVPGRVSTVSLSTSAKADASIKNSLVFYVSVIPKESDLHSPSCRILNVTEDVCLKNKRLLCNLTRWDVRVAVQDLGSGLKLFKPSVSYSMASFSSDPFEKGTKEEVVGFYESSCCHRNITLVAVDDNGNVGRCLIAVSSAPSIDIEGFQYFLVFFLYLFNFF